MPDDVTDACGPLVTRPLVDRRRGYLGLELLDDAVAVDLDVRPGRTSWRTMAIG
jgi:hypothetical protein